MNNNYEEYDEFDKNLINKIDRGEDLTEKEIETLVYKYPKIDTKYGDNRRWVRSVFTVIELCGRYIGVDWDEGLTEEQANTFYYQPYEVEKHEYEKTIKVTEWIKKENK